MLQKLRTVWLRARSSRLWRWAAKHRLGLLISATTAGVFVCLLVAGSYLLIEPYGRYVFEPQDQAAIRQQHVRVGLVLGSDVNVDGQPGRGLQARLDAAAAALQAGDVDMLLLSGDNRRAQYNEPKAMLYYLIHTKHIASNKLQPDYAGRSTYESCDRAANIFGVRKTIIFSARSHLPRAIFLCRHFGIEAYGMPSGIEANNAARREPLARVKAMYNVYVHGEPTVLGAPINL